MGSLGEEYPLEQNRCRELLEVYKSIGQPGWFGHAMIGQVLERADKAAMSGDVVAMLNSFEEMKGCE